MPFCFPNQSRELGIKKEIPLRQKVPNSFEFENISHLMGTFFGSSAHFMLKIITDYRELRSEFEATNACRRVG